MRIDIKITRCRNMKSERCVVCGRSRSRFLFTSYDRMFKIAGTFRIIHCQSCGVLFLHPKPSDLKKYYPSKKYYAYAGEKKGFFGIIRDLLITHRSFFLPSVPAIPPVRLTPGKILDVGCGTGDTLLVLERLGWDGYGLDIDEHALEIAKKRGVNHVRLGSYRDIARYPDNYFDVIRLYHVIEHLDNPRLCLKLLWKKLKKDGRIYIGTPNAASVAARLFGTYWYNLDSPRHLMIFSPANLSRLVHSEQFTSVTYSFSSAGGIIGSIGYWLEERFGRKLSLIHNVPLVLLLYPLEKLLDALGFGDVFVVEARKS